VIAVVPVFNEAATVGGVVSALTGVCPVIVVDDGSTDGSDARAAAAGAAVVRTARRSGKGAALRAGFAEALRMRADAVVTLDGDGQHDPGELPGLLAAAAGTPEALVIGDRLGGGGDRIPPARLAAIRAADVFVRWLTRSPVRDSQCGFRIYPAAFLRAAPLRQEGFVLETEALVGAARRGHALVSVPVRAIYPRDRASRFRALADGARIGRYLAREVVREASRRLAADERGRRLRLPAPVADA
jgi:glycosyltransferase involved in cell wall biosynthesis